MEAVRAILAFCGFLNLLLSENVTKRRKMKSKHFSDISNGYHHAIVFLSYHTIEQRFENKMESHIHDYKI